MTAVVVGPGALGSLLAALLTDGGVPTTLLDHDRQRAARLAQRGLTVSGPGRATTHRVEVPMAADPSALRADLVLVCVKARDTAAAAAAAARVRGTPTVLVLQNGLGRAEAVAETLGDPRRVVGAVTAEGATRIGEGQVHHAGRGPTILAPLDLQGAERAAGAARLLRQAGLEVRVEADLAAVVWAKLQVNAAINALTGLLGCRNGALLTSPAAAALADEAAEEVAQVAVATGVAGNWRPEVARARWREVAERTGDNLSSTLQDLQAGRKTEVFAINGAIARAAATSGCAAPVNALLARLVAAREELLEAAPPSASSS